MLPISGTLGRNKNQLVVEGKDDLHSVVHLMSAHIDWPKNDEPVSIKDGDGRSKVLHSGYLTTILKHPDTRALGVMLDAEEEDPNLVYVRVRGLCLTIFPRLPNSLLPTGVIANNEDGQRFGVWIMPDNSSRGTLETFLRYLVPPEEQSIWAYATESVKQARDLGAKCRETHIEKANLHTWLAWQDEPGYPPGTALTRGLLDPRAESAASFVEWFRTLYSL